MVKLGKMNKWSDTKKVKSVNKIFECRYALIHAKAGNKADWLEGFFMLLDKLIGGIFLFLLMGVLFFCSTERKRGT